MEFISYVVIAVIAMWVGWHVRGIIFTAAISENPDKIIQILEEIKKINRTQKTEKTVDDAVLVNVEEIRGVVYLFQADTDRFVGQGDTIDAAFKMANERFPNKKFWAPTTLKESQTA